MKKRNPSKNAPWYIVLEAWHPFIHHGLDGLPWPLDSSSPWSIQVDKEMLLLPFTPGDCFFRGCFDINLAKAYFTEASRQLKSVYLARISPLDTPEKPYSGVDMGRPSGGFSIIGQEICKTEDDHIQFGHMLNEHGLFPDESTLFQYLDMRRRRADADELEHLDESIPTKVTVIDVAERRADLRPRS